MAQSRSEPQSVDSELNPFAFRAFGTGSKIADTLIREIFRGALRVLLAARPHRGELAGAPVTSEEGSDASLELESQIVTLKSRTVSPSISF